MRALRLAPFLLLFSLVCAASASAAPSVTTIADSLDSPRHLAFGKAGDLFIAEAGRGGSGPSVRSRSWSGRPAMRSITRNSTVRPSIASSP